MKAWFFDSQDPEQTFERAVALGRSVGADGLTIGLIGPLGAGKTVFVKGLAEGLGIDSRVVSSPTFVIAQQYAIPTGPEALHHVDLYRLESATELESIGFEDMLAAGQVLAVEWADRFPEALGPELLRIEFEGPSPEEDDALREGIPWRGRRARIEAFGVEAEQVLADWAGRIEEEESSFGARGEEGRRGGGDGSSGRFVREARVLMMLLLGLGLCFSSALEFDSGRVRCDSLVEIEADELGTLHARCDDSEGRSHSQRPITGIARLLDGQKVDLNRASQALLRSLPQLGPSRAEAIVRARSIRPDQRFSSTSELDSIMGIGPVTLTRIERWLFVAERGEDRGVNLPGGRRSGDG